MPVACSAGVQIYEYTLSDKDGKDQCVAGMLDELRCNDEDRVCSGKFYEVDRNRGAADPDALMELYLNEARDEVHSMSIRHNTSDRYLDALLFSQKNKELQIPSIKVGPTTINKIKPLCHSAQCNGYRLNDDDETVGFMINVTCDDRVCEGDMIKNNEVVPEQRIQMTMTGRQEPRGRDCRNPTYANVGCVKAKLVGEQSWTSKSAKCAQ